MGIRAVPAAAIAVIATVRIQQETGWQIGVRFLAFGHLAIAFAGHEVVRQEIPRVVKPCRPSHFTKCLERIGVKSRNTLAFVTNVQRLLALWVLGRDTDGAMVRVTGLRLNAAD